MHKWPVLHVRLKMSLAYLSGALFEAMLRNSMICMQRFVHRFSTILLIGAAVPSNIFTSQCKVKRILFSFGGTEINLHTVIQFSMSWGTDYFSIFTHAYLGILGGITFLTFLAFMLDTGVGDQVGETKVNWAKWRKMVTEIAAEHFTQSEMCDYIITL